MSDRKDFAYRNAIKYLGRKLVMFLYRSAVMGTGGDYYVSGLSQPATVIE